MSGGDRETVARMFSAITRGDAEGALACVHPEVVWSPTVWSSAATLRGREEVRGWFAQFGPNLEDLTIHITELTQKLGWVAALGTVHDTRDGGAFSTRVGWTFAVRDGLVVEGRAHESWDAARQAAGIESKSDAVEGEELLS